MAKTVEGRCMKCKAQVVIKGGKVVSFGGNRRAYEGKCGDCGTKVFRILSAADAAKM